MLDLFKALSAAVFKVSDRIIKKSHLKKDYCHHREFTKWKAGSE